METLVRAVGALACVMVVLGIVAFVLEKTHPAPPATLPPDLSRPVLAIELAKFDEAKGILGDLDAKGDSPMRVYLRKGLYGDYFFIALYWLLFVGMSALLAKRSHRWAVWAGVIAAVCATSAAIFDVVENLSIAALVDAPDIREHLVRNVTAAASGKWLLISIALLILSLVFLRRNWLALLGGLYFLIGVLGIYGVLQMRGLVQLSFMLSLLGVLFVAVIFTRWPEKILEHH
jgi:hypothetical protein